MKLKIHESGNPSNYIKINHLINPNKGLWIAFKKYEVQYKKGNLINSDGSPYKGKGVKVKKNGEIKIKNSFLEKVFKALDKIKKSKESNLMISELELSKNKFTIIKNSSSKHIATNVKKAYENQFKTDPKQQKTYNILIKKFNYDGGSGSKIYWNSSGANIITHKGSKKNAPIDLAHEMFHALDANRGLLDDRDHKGIKRSEWQASYRENILRLELHISVRTHYLLKLDSSTGKRTGLPPKLVDSINSPILPHWYKK